MHHCAICQLLSADLICRITFSPRHLFSFDSSNETERNFIQNGCDFQLCEATKKKKKEEWKILETITSICKFQFWFANSSKNHYRTWQCQLCLLYLKYFAAHSRTSTFYLLCIAFQLVPSMQSSNITRSILQAVPLGYTLILPCPSGLLDTYLSCEI